MARIKVFDAFSLLTFLEDGSDAQLIRDLFIKAEDKKARIKVTSLNLSEVWNVIATAKSHEKADRIIKDLCNMPIEIIDVDWKLSQIAALLSSKTGLPIVSCIAPALAKISKGELVTGNSNLIPLGELIKIIWLSDDTSMSS